MSDTNGPHPAERDPDPRRLFAFIALTARLREVERPNNATPLRRESAAEHSWHLAMVSWILHTEFEREAGHPIDLTKMLKMCLMHDLVEMDAVDTASSPNFAGLPGALGTELLELWHEYEEGSTPEACLVRGVDRLNPVLMRRLTGQGWHEVATDSHAPMDAEALDRQQLPRVGVSETLRALYEEIRNASVASGLLPGHSP